jgi:hypothetical protein
MLTNRKSRVMDAGPAAVHHQEGVAARVKRKRPHQKLTSPK